MATCTLIKQLQTTVSSPNTTGTFTPTSGSLLVALLHAVATVSDPGTLNSSIGGFTFTQFRADEKGGVNDWVYGFVADALVTDTSSQTITWDPGDASNGLIIGLYEIIGVTRFGLSAIRQSASGETTAAGTPSVTLSSAALTGNPVLTMIGNDTNPIAITEPSGWTEGFDLGHATPDSGGQICHRDSGFTGTTITWGSTTATDSVQLAVEIDASALGHPALSRYRGTPGMSTISSRFGRGW